MGTNNYLKVVHPKTKADIRQEEETGKAVPRRVDYFFFDDTDEQSVLEAFRAARKVLPPRRRGGMLVAFRGTVDVHVRQVCGQPVDAVVLVPLHVLKRERFEMSNLLN